MNLFKFRPSLTKSWPGGRRSARLGDTWNPYISDFKKPYTRPQPPKPEVEGGMATPSEEPSTCTPTISE